MATSKNRMGLKKKVLIALGVLVVAVAAIPLWAPSLVLSRVLSGANEHLNGTVTASSLSFTWGGHVTLSGIEVKDLGGQLKLRIATLTADVDVGAAMKGDIHAQVELDRPEVFASAGKSQPIDLMELVKVTPASPPAPTTSPSTPASPGPTARPKNPEIDITVRDGKVTFTNPLGAATSMDMLNATVSAGKNGGGAAGHASFRVGSATWVVDGQVAEAASGQKGSLSYEIPITNLNEFAPLATSFVALTRLVGTIHGKGRVDFDLPAMMSGDGTLTLDGVEVDGPLVGGKLTKVPTLTASFSRKLDQSGAGSVDVALNVKDTLTAHIEGRSTREGQDTHFVTTLDTDGDVASMVSTAAGMLGTKEGVKASGKVQLRGKIEGTLADGAMRRATWSSTLKGSELDIRTPQGKRLQGLANLNATFAGNHNGKAVTLTQGDFQVASCKASVVGEMDLAAGAFRDGKVTAEGDLDALSAELRQIVDLPAELAGKFKLAADVSKSDTAVIRASLSTTNLRVTQPTRAFGPLNLDASAEGTVTFGDMISANISHWSLRGEGTALEGALVWKDSTADVRVKGSARPLTTGRAFGVLTPSDRMDDTPVKIDVDMSLVTTVGKERIEFRQSRIEHRNALITATGGLNGARLEGALMEISATADLQGLLMDLGTFASKGGTTPSGKISAKLQARGATNRADITASVEIANLDVTLPAVGGGRATRITEPRFLLDLSGSLDPTTRALVIPSFSMSGAGTELQGNASWSEQETKASVRGKLKPAPLLAMTGALPTGMALEGDVSFDIATELRGVAAAFKGRIEATNVALALPMDTKGQGRVLTDKSLVVSFDGTSAVVQGLRRVDLTSMKVTSTHFSLDAKGRVPMSVTDLAEFDVAAKAQIKPLLTQLGVGDLGGASTDGRADLTMKVRGEVGLTRLMGRINIADFLVAVPEAEGRQAIKVNDPSVDLVFDTSMMEKSLEARLNEVALKSTFVDAKVSGSLVGLADVPTFKGVSLTASYDPTRLGVVLSAFADVTVTGTGRRQITAELDGPVVSTDFAGLLRLGKGTTTIALAPMQMGALTLDGNVTSSWKQGTLEAQGDLKFNGGPLNVTSSLALAPGTKGSTLKARLKGAQATGQLSPLASMVNPIFAVTGGAGSSLTGLIDADLDLSVSGQLTESDLNGGWETFRKERIDGTGRLGFSQGAVQGSTMLLKLADLILGTGASEVSLEPITFTIRQGRLSYDRPLKMSVKGLDLVWTGSVGLDRTLALNLEIPVTDALRARLPFLTKLRVDTLRLPVKGTTANPDVNVGGLLADLAKQALIGEVTGGNSGGGILGGTIGGLLGGKDKNKPPPPTPPASRPNSAPIPAPTPAPIPPRTSTPPVTNPPRPPIELPVPATSRPIPKGVPIGRPASRPVVPHEPESKPAPKKKRGLFGGG